MFQEGVTREDNDSLLRRYVSLGIEEEFGIRGGLEQRLLVNYILNKTDSISSLRNKIIAKNGNNEMSQKEFSAALEMLVKDKHAVIKGDKIIVELAKNGAVKKYIDYFKHLGFDVPLAKRLEAALQRKYNREFNIGVIDGKVIDIEERESTVDELGRKLEGILCTTDTGGEGLDFTHASYGYFLDRDYKPKTDEQGIARLLRKGQKKKVKIFRLLGADCCDEPLEDYVERKRIIIRTAIDGYPITDEERTLLEDIEGKQFAEILRKGLSGISINTLEAKIEDIHDFGLKKRIRKLGKNGFATNNGDTTTEAQELMKLIGQDPVNCWQKSDFVEMYMRLLPNLAVPVIHRARISDLIRRAEEGEIVFPRKVLSDGSGPSILYEAYKELFSIIKKHGFKVPTVVDRDISKAMLAKGSNPRKVHGCMTGKKSAFKEKGFDMVDNASISLLQNSGEVKRVLLESHRVLRPGTGLLELTVEGRRFYDGSSDCEVKIGDKIVKMDFYEGLEKLGFKVISEKNQGFAVSRDFFRRLKELKGAHFAEAYERKLTETYFLLAQKVDNPTDVDAANFWWSRPERISKEENQQEAIDPRESRNIIMPGRRRGRKSREEEKEVFVPKKEIKVDKSGNVISIKEIGGE